MPDTRLFDAIVVGSGAAGGFAARELTARGLSVLMLEAGPDIGRKDFEGAPKTAARKDINIWERVRATLKGQPVQARAAFFTQKFAKFFVHDGKNPYTTPRNAPFLWIRGRQSGGRLHSFGRVLLRWTDYDFKRHSRTGSGIDWPISYADLEPFYRQIEEHLGLYGNDDHAPTLPDGIYAAPAKLTAAEEDFRDRIQARHPDRHVVSWRYIPPDPTRIPRPLRDALATGRLTVRHNAIVRRIATDPQTGRATGAVFTDRLTRKTFMARAKSVVLCASTIESVRLLLNSATARHPNGLGNSSGMLGRYFMDQCPSLAFGAYPPTHGWTHDDSAPADPFYNPSGGVYIPRFSDRDGQSHVGGFTFQGAIGRSEIPDDQPARLSLFGFGEMQPYADNRITLDRHRRDAWNVPVPRIRCVLHDNEKKLLAAQEKTLVDMVHEAGGEIEFIGSPEGLREMGRGAFPDANWLTRLVFRKWFRKTMCMGAAIHESGGARMGDDPANSVLDRWNRCWDVPNLFVTDASAFPTGGSVGTTLTVMALTVRACGHLADQLEAGTL
ncbi:GMC oxidoreductase [Tanticharoenia sakaeratensis]|uniref:Oxidoreductase protein n=1 Tax=Tanticharoenia sakaeratensis NBRC 103193 TaxID=1231623 RepID=A0A0D6MQF4_9PROT|nr:GMC family oxidoreductase [Tanticharoenia sakaeratensis]GAN55503.1 oxidoreductase protein [Tanticharoenia sakaeratensis NBRC 103193]GBQ21896.1 sorbitol dehydrogenase [Tanticharoenia sakaeratensis NBRC 103193]